MERSIIIGMIPLVIGLIVLLIAHIPLKLLIWPFLIRMKMLRGEQVIHFAAPIALKDYQVVRSSRKESTWAFYLVSAFFWLYYLCLIFFVLTIVCIAVFDSSAWGTRNHGTMILNLDRIF